MNTLNTFTHTIKSYYQEHKRPFAWRDIENPYYVVVSEIMLQQTQTYRVAPKYEQFIELFPDFQALAAAPLHAVLSAWQGLGYNRRAKFLHQIAQKVVAEFDNRLPDGPEQLVSLPGIGPNTAGSIAAFAFNKPVVFIETNIRSVFIHFFFKDKQEVHDKELIPLIEQTLDTDNPRQWYYALMDYGVMLKSTQPNPSRKSKHHAKQSKFEGSDRQIRGMILKLLTQYIDLSVDEFCEYIPREKDRIEKALNQLSDEQMVKAVKGRFVIC